MNLRKILSSDQWDIIRKDCYKDANYVCELCGGDGKDQGYLHSVECHEKWDYTIGSPSGHQVLTGVISLCPRCHLVKHIGLAEIRGKRDEAVRHLGKVNKCSTSEAETAVNSGFIKWNILNQYAWDVDVSWVERKYGFKIDKDT